MLSEHLRLTPQTSSRILTGMVVLAVSLASFLSFSVQPLVGKLLLPVQGGAASTWLGTMLFFQSALLLGYGWAAWLLGRRPIVQVGATAVLALISVLACKPDWASTLSWTGISGILLTLSLAGLPAMVLLFSTGPLMHGWLRGRGQPVPYHLYAISNAGSLAAVVLYPFVVEPSIGLSEQVFLWQSLLWILAGLVGTVGLLVVRDRREAIVEPEEPEAIAPQRVLSWIGLSALPCIGLLGATHHLAAEIGSNPLAWVGPFGGFLLSFLLIFSGWWQTRFTLATLAWLAISLTGFMLTKGVSNGTVDGSAVFWLLSLTTAGSFFANGQLHELRPQRCFAFFYLMVAAGGVLGGVFASLLAPFFFRLPSEFLAVSCVLLAIGLLRLLARRDPLTVAVALIVALSPTVGSVWMQTRDEGDGPLQIRRFRNVYGYMMVKTQPAGVVLSSETTTHGGQLTVDDEARRRPTYYFTESSGLGRTIEEIQKARPSINVGVVGLGAGTIAAYARPDDTIDFWDIDPKAIRIAQDYFTFVRDARGQIQIHQADGRKGLASSATDYDLIVIDAFCGDAIPPHLLTREALTIYLQRLEKRGGFLIIHASNRYSTLFPIVAATARSCGWSALSVTTEITDRTESRDWDAVVSQYILVCPHSRVQELIAWFPPEEEGGRVKRTVLRHETKSNAETVVWTDDLHAAIDAIDLRRYLAGH